MSELCKKIVDLRAFQIFITTVIVLNALVIGMETSQSLSATYHFGFRLINQLVLLIFILEAILKMIALSPRPLDYFKDGWNCFDFIIIVLSLLPETGQMAMLARLARLLRVFRLISTIPELRLIVDTLLRSIPSMGWVVTLMSIIFYIYGVAGYHLFSDTDPVHWRTLGISLLSLFRIVTLEDWTDVMYAAMEKEPYAWLYFVSFVIVGTFVMVNLFIAVVINNLEQAKTMRLESMLAVPGRDEILRELKDTQDSLQRLHAQMEKAQFIHPEESDPH